MTTTVIEQADVATTKTGPATVNAGQNLTYALTVSNAGPSAAATVVVTDTLPGGRRPSSRATGGGTLSGNVITWPAIASLASGASQGYSVTVTAPATGVAHQHRWRARRRRRTRTRATTTGRRRRAE